MQRSNIKRYLRYVRGHGVPPAGKAGFWISILSSEGSSDFLQSVQSSVRLAEVLWARQKLLRVFASAQILYQCNIKMFKVRPVKALFSHPFSLIY